MLGPNPVSTMVTMFTKEELIVKGGWSGVGAKVHLLHPRDHKFKATAATLNVESHSFSNNSAKFLATRTQKMKKYYEHTLLVL